MYVSDLLPFGKTSKKMKKEVVAIFDIGKTNKKFLLFDDNFEVEYEEVTELQETEDEEGFPCEDVQTLQNWIQKTVEERLKDERYRIGAVNFSTYGASLVHVGHKGEPVAPLYSYLKPFPESLLQTFYQEYGPRSAFCQQTASPSLGMLNSGLLLYWLKYKKSEVFQQIQYSLHLPQYCSYLLHGKAVSELTSIGCHTGLWDYEKADYHAWVYQEEIAGKLPAIVPTEQTFSAEVAGTKLSCGVGVHDSSAALIPYIELMEEPFLLVSTGTWSITLNAFSKDALSQDLLEQDCLNFLTYGGETVRASRLFLGHEHSLHVKKMEAYFQKQKGAFKEIKPDHNIISHLLKEQKQNLEKEEVKLLNADQLLPDYEWSRFGSFEEAYHQLVFDLTRLQVKAILLAKGSSEVKKVIVTGGFCDNEIFLRLLANQLPGMSLMISRMKRASAIGAAILLHKSVPEEAKKSMRDFRTFLPDPE